MKDRDDIEKRYNQYFCHELPGQPLMMHMGTLYLVNDLHNALTAAEKELDRLRGLVNDVFYTVLSRSAHPEAMRRAMLNWIMKHESDAPTEPLHTTETEGSDE